MSTTTDTPTRELLLAVFTLTDQITATVTARHGHVFADEVHARLLRRIDTGTSLTDPTLWLDPDGAVRIPALAAWLHTAARGELADALRMRRQDPIDLEHHPAEDSSGASPSADRAGDPAVPAPDDDPRVVLTAVRCATRELRMRPATRCLALLVLEGRLDGRSFADIADQTGVLRNTAIQYHHRLVRSLPATLQRRVERCTARARRMTD